MGLAIIMAIAWSIVLSSLLWVKKWWTYLICFVVGIGGLFGLMAFVLWAPFDILMPTELSETIDLQVLSEENILLQQDKEWNLTDDNLKIEVTYKFSNIPDNCKYLFIDENNQIYYVKDDSVKVAQINSTGGINTDNIRTSSVEIITGNYEKVYVEKYVTRSKATFLSIGIIGYDEYKLYIPQSMASE